MPDVVRFRLDGRVHRMVGEVNEKRPVARLVDHLHGLVGEPVGEVFAGLPELQVRHVAKLRPVTPAPA